MTIPFDPERYLHYLNNSDMTADHKLDLMQYVWLIMEGFVDRAFGQSPEQILLRDRKQNCRDRMQSEIAPLNNALKDNFKHAARNGRKTDQS